MGSVWSGSVHEAGQRKHIRETRGKEQETVSSQADVVLAALAGRRTCRTYTDQPVPDGILNTMLEAARWAPNHRLTNPWRFFVVRKDSPVRSRIAQAVYDWTYENVTNPSPERRVQSAGVARQEIINAPALLYAFSIPGPDEEVTTENYAATCCAIQNMQVAAYACGVAVGWSTGKPAKPASVPSLLGADPSWRLVGALFCGFPAVDMKQERKPVADVTAWV
jgi:nitroreductase